MGWPVVYEWQPGEKIGSLVLNQATTTGKAFYDGWTLENSWTIDLWQAGLVEPLDSLVSGDVSLNWTDFVGCAQGRRSRVCAQLACHSVGALAWVR